MILRWHAMQKLIDFILTLVILQVYENLLLEFMEIYIVRYSIVLPHILISTCVMCSFWFCLSKGIIFSRWNCRIRKKAEWQLMSATSLKYLFKMWQWYIVTKVSIIAAILCQGSYTISRKVEIKCLLAPRASCYYSNKC